MIEIFINAHAAGVTGAGKATQASAEQTPDTSFVDTMTNA
jgi:hypothetical protein